MTRFTRSTSAVCLFRLAVRRAFNKRSRPTPTFRVYPKLHALEGREAPGETLAAVAAGADYLGVGASLLEIDPPTFPAPGLVEPPSPPAALSESTTAISTVVDRPTADADEANQDEPASWSGDLPEPGEPLIGLDLSLTDDDSLAAAGDEPATGGGGTSADAGTPGVPSGRAPTSATTEPPITRTAADVPAPEGDPTGSPTALAPTTSGGTAGSSPVAPPAPSAVATPARPAGVWVEAVEANADHPDQRGFRVWRDGSSGNLPVRYRLTGAATTTERVTITDGNRSAAVVVPGGAEARITLLSGGGYVPTTVTTAKLDRFAGGRPEVSVHADSPVVAEGSADGAAVTFTRTVAVGDLVVHYTVRGTATPGTDYQPLSGTVVIPDRRDRATVWVRPAADVQTDATVEVSVESDGGYDIGPAGTATVVIQDLAPGEPVLPRSGIAGGPADGGWSSHPVRYWDGKVWYKANDLESDGFGGPWAIRRTWSNLPAFANDAYNGSGWLDANTPRLLSALPGRVILIQNGDRATAFTLLSGSYISDYFTTDQLAYDSTPDEFVLTDGVGNQWRLFNPANTSLPVLQRGQFKSFTDRYGNVTQVTGWRTDGKPNEVQRSYTAGGTTTTESFLYAYVSGGTNDGLLASVTLQRRVGTGSWSTIRKVEYSYYDGTTVNGNAGDLESAVTKDSGNNVLGTEYYRYYKDTTSGGYVGGLKYAFREDSYARLKAWADANSTTVSAATDTQIAPYADHNFQFDATSKKVTQEVAKGAGASGSNGGLGTFAFSYTSSGAASWINDWDTKTVETLPDGNQNIVYTNRGGAVLLSAFKEVGTGDQWITYNHFDNDGRVDWTAYPSAVTGYDDTYSDLLNFSLGTSSYLRDDAGLFELNDYYTSTTATSSTAGGVAGYFQGTSLRRGESGTAIAQRQDEYYSRSNGSITIYPLATTTVYRNDDGTGGQTTSIAYTWGSGFDAQTVAITLPTVTTGQNGPGMAATVTTAFDDFGNPFWFRDADGFLHYREFDGTTGAIIKAISDVSTSQSSTFTGLPSGWSTPTGGGLHLTDTAEVDALGRTTKYTSANSNVSYYTFDDVNQELRSYLGWNTSSNTPTGPTIVQRRDRARGYFESLTMSATPAVSSGRPIGTESVSGVQTLSRDHFNNGDQLVNRDEYYDLTGLTYSTSTSLGTEGTNFNRTRYDHNANGVPDRMVSPAGTIYRIWHDALGREASTWIGLDDTPSSGAWSPTNTSGTDLVKTSDSEYDGGGVGDGNLTRSTEYPGGGAAARRSDFYFDWRDQLVAVKDGVETSESTSLNRPLLYLDFDNLGQVTKERTYDADGVSLTTTNGVPQPPSSSLLRAQVAHSFDEVGREYRTETNSVDPSTGSISSTALTANVWFDKRGNRIKQTIPGGPAQKVAFDGAGRPMAAYTSDAGGDSAYADADDVSGDAVLEQVEWTHDGVGNVLVETVRQRFHDETGTGALGTPTTGVKARVSYAASFYDLADRLTDVVDVGTNGGSAYTRPATVPSRSDAVLVTSYGYNQAGWLADVTDAKGLLSKSYFDLAGNVTKVIENYVNGTVSDADDKTVEFDYGPAGRTKVRVQLTGGGQQVTESVYGVSTSGGLVSNDIVGTVKYPDPSTGSSSSSEQKTLTFNQIGEVQTATDRNGNVHTYYRDVLGRPTSDTVTTLGSGVDGSVRRIEVGYNTQGLAYLFTSADAVTGGNTVNQVQRDFNGLGQMTAEYQAVNGAVNTGTTPKVQYAYTEMASGANHSRLTDLTYPNGRNLDYTYSSGLNDGLSRLSSIVDGSTTLESYEYLGLGTVVKRSHPQPGVDLTFIKLSGESDGDAGDKYAGLDRFGRVADQRWTTSGGTTKDRFKYGYDRNSNPLYKENLVDSTRSELFTYDGFNQLATFARGTLNGTKDAISGTASRTQSWDFDALGNFEGQTTDSSTQTRTHNKQNELLTASGQTSPTYDANGNQTKDLADRRFKYDAWNQVVEVQPAGGGSPVRTYERDALGRRVQETASGTTTDFYYSAGWQVLEERVGGNAKASYTWSPVYVDALIARDRDTDANGSLDERLYAVQDANYNVTAILDTSGNVVERYGYDPFGTPAYFDASYGTRSSSSYGWSYLHQGLHWDGTTGKQWNRRRDYDPAQGRFTANDPLGFGAGDPDLYRYVGNMPSSATDPSGLMYVPISSLGWSREQWSRWRPGPLRVDGKFPEQHNPPEGTTRVGRFIDAIDPVGATWDWWWAEVQYDMNDCGGPNYRPTPNDDGQPETGDPRWATPDDMESAGSDSGERIGATKKRVGPSMKLMMITALAVIGWAGINRGIGRGTGPGGAGTRAKGAPVRVTGEALAKLRREFKSAKPQAWIDEAARNPHKYTRSQLAAMKKGEAPIGSDGFPMEIHHRTPLAEGGTNTMDNFDFLTRTDHRLGENYKKNHPNLP